TPQGSIELPMLATGLLWLVTRGAPLADPAARLYVAWALTHLDLGSPPAPLVPPEMPGAAFVNSHRPVQLQSTPGPLRLTLAWAQQDLGGSRVAVRLRRSAPQLRSLGIRIAFRPATSLPELLELAGPPPRAGVDLVLLGW